MTPLEAIQSPSQSATTRPSFRVITDATQLRHRDDLKVYPIDGEALAYDPRTSDTHRLNETAYFIWQCCDGRHTLGAIAVRLMGAYEVAFSIARAATRDACVELLEKELVECQ